MNEVNDVRSYNICCKYNDCKHDRKCDTDFAEKLAFCIDFPNHSLVEPHYLFAYKGFPYKNFI